MKQGGRVLASRDLGDSRNTEYGIRNTEYGIRNTEQPLSFRSLYDFHFHFHLLPGTSDDGDTSSSCQLQCNPFLTAFDISKDNVFYAVPQNVDSFTNGKRPVHADMRCKSLEDWLKPAGVRIGMSALAQQSMSLSSMNMRLSPDPYPLPCEWRM